MEYAALKGVCRDYLDGNLSDEELYQYHTVVAHNSHRSEKWFGAHPVFGLIKLIHDQFIVEMRWASCDNRPTFDEMTAARGAWKMSLRNAIGGYGLQSIIGYTGTMDSVSLIHGHAIVYNN
jgi:hypothetical protein